MSENMLLHVKNLGVSFHTEEGELGAVQGLSFSLSKGQTLGIVGESGCGKSVTSLAVMGLIPCPPGKIVSGEIIYKGRDLLKVDSEELRKLRGSEISMIFQEPMTSLNPVYKIGDQISESVILHQKLNPKDARDRSIEMLKMVGIPSPEKRVDDYPHQLSGGMRQRVMIAMALSCNPEILIADEPTTALDVTIQAQILDLLGELKEKIGMAMILITHDLGVVSQVADDILVMYSGRAVEFGSVSEVMKNPKMPYTRGLLECLPRFEHGAASTQNKIKVRRKLETIPGMVPSLLSLPSGCRFRDRCSYSVTECSQSEPELRGINSSGSSPHLIRCIKDI